jgi:hypothetical protein
MKKRYIPLAISCLSCFTGNLLAEGYAVCHHFNLYADYLYMKRSKIHSKSIVDDSAKPPCNPLCPTCDPCPDFVVLSTKKLVQNFDFESGYRIGGAYTFNRCFSLEGNYMWLNEWTGSKTRKADRNLKFPFDKSSFAHDFNHASRAHARYTSQIWGTETNLWWHLTARRADYFSVSTLYGLRYFNLKEKFDLDFTRGQNTSSYDIETKNDLAGAQVGLNLQVNPYEFLVWEFTGKIGGFLDYVHSKVFLGDFNNKVTLRNSSQRRYNGSFMADLAASLGFQFASWFNLHIGYQFLYLNGRLALAPEQIDKKPVSQGRDPYVKGDIYIFGLFAGGIISF